MRAPRGKSRNEGRPFQGIDTYNGFVVCLQVPFVEMKAAPFRALTHLSVTCKHVIDASVEMKAAPSQLYKKSAITFSVIALYLSHYGNLLFHYPKIFCHFSAIINTACNYDK